MCRWLYSLMLQLSESMYPSPTAIFYYKVVRGHWNSAATHFVMMIYSILSMGNCYLNILLNSYMLPKNAIREFCFNTEYLL